MMLEGKLLNDRYQIKHLIGGGGMANVYLGDDTILNREVAIKVLKLEFANDEEFIIRFHREAQAAISLSHPNIVNIYDVGDEDNIYYMVMEYIDGMTLKQYIQQRAPIEVEEVIDIMTQLTSAISHAHENHLIHRDIKPQNVLMNRYGQVKITDFGIAVALSSTALTQTNSVLGSVHYLSPEQARGGKANNKSDIYSLGIVMYELLTGTLPFSGHSPVSIALKHLQTNTPSIREKNESIPQSIENIVFKATAKDPFLRYQTAYDMEEDLLSALDPERLNEPKFLVPVSDDTVTKAIPVVSLPDSEGIEDVSDETIIHSPKKEKGKKSKNKPENKKPKKNKKKKAFKWVIGLFVVLLGAILLALFVFPSVFQPKDVTIPDLTNVPYEEALEELTNLKLTVSKEMTVHEEIEEDHVVQTSPRADEVVKEGREIQVFVSSGPEKVEFEDYTGTDFERTRRLLEGQGFDTENIVVYEVFSEEPSGQIVKQEQPNEGDLVIPSEARIIFEVSKGRETFPINRLVGLEVDEATKYLEEQGLEPSISEAYSSEVEEGIVMEQNPKSNESVVKGDEVSLIVSQGPEPKSPINHTASFSIPYTGDEGDPQEVSIFVEDMNHQIGELYQEVELITKDTTFHLDLVIAPEESATYRVLRDDNLILEKSITYEQVEGE